MGDYVHRTRQNVENDSGYLCRMNEHLRCCVKDKMIVEER